MGRRDRRRHGGLGVLPSKLLAAIGAWVGLGLVPVTLFLAACLGLLTAGGTMPAGRRQTAASGIPFWPFLALAAWLPWLYADSAGTWLLI
jgi:leader peptidase (prepilin peptidase) / N-methyltransferase